jgi:hypothetical protein
VNVWVNSFTDAQGAGDDMGALLSLGPRLHIVLDGEDLNLKELHPVDARCHRCRQVIRGRNLSAQPDLRVLACRCVMVLFGAEFYSHDFITGHWKHWRRIKRSIETQLAAANN